MAAMLVQSLDALGVRVMKSTVEHDRAGFGRFAKCCLEVGWYFGIIVVCRCTLTCMVIMIWIAGMKESDVFECKGVPDADRTH